MLSMEQTWNGVKTIIGLYIENKENSRYWIDQIEKMKSRGLKEVLFVSTESNKRLEQGLKIVYNPIIKISINEQVAKIAKYTQCKWESTGERELVRAYLSETVEDFKEQMRILKEKYHENQIGLILLEKFEKENEEDIEKVPKEIRHLICSYNTKRRMIDMGIRATRDYEEIESIADLVEKERELFTKFEMRRSYSKKAWSEILNKLYGEKYEGIKEYIEG